MKYIFAAMLLTIGSAYAADDSPKCFPRAKVIEVLKSKGAAPVFVGIIDEESALEFWMVQPNQQWVQLLTNVDGKSCIIVNGKGLGIVLDAEIDVPQQEG